ncbi:ABC transporter permease [Candidatus Acetothermia bacterium]|nr:ABC transporter permease [Candidatus Acetothermia bacterium]
MGEKAQGSLQIPLSSRLSDSLKAGLRSRGLKRFFKNPLSVTGLFLILFFAFIATFASWLAPTKCALLTPPDPECVDKPLEMPNDGVALIPKPPQAEAWQTFPPDWRLHPFGVIVGGYDLYYGIIWGTRSAFYVGIIVVGFSLLVGILIGSLAGYFGGWVDELLMRFVDILFVFPGFVFAVTLSVLIVQIQHFDILGFKFSLDRLGSAVVAIAVVNWLSYSRLVRGDILSTKEKEFVQAARAAGASHFRVILRHILPNTIYPVLVTASLDIGSIVLNIAAFSFLNLGPPPNYADWGQIISASRSFVTQLDYWYVIIIPSVTITLFVLGWNLLGDAFRDVLDPKLRGRGS